MKVYIVENLGEPHKNKSLVAAFKLRKEVFVDELKWKDLIVREGLEIDQFDNKSAVHFVLENEGRVTGYSRLLPTTEPHLLSDVYPYLPDRIPRSPDVYEWTRLCISRQERQSSAWGLASLEIALHVATFCVENEISQLSWQGHPVWISRFTQIGFQPRPLGLPQMVAGQMVVAAIMDINDEVYTQMLAIHGMRQPNAAQGPRIT